MNTAAVIRRLTRHQPTSALELLDTCELPLQYIGGGAFRDAYHVLGTSLVIKMPRKCKSVRLLNKRRQHARDEYEIWKRINRSRRKFKTLQKYLPELIYYNFATGVMVVRKYEKAKWSRALNALITDLERTVTKIMKTKEADIHYGNLGVDRRGKIKIIDMGLFIKGEV